MSIARMSVEKLIEHYIKQAGDSIVGADPDPTFFASGIMPLDPLGQAAALYRQAIALGDPSGAAQFYLGQMFYYFNIKVSGEDYLSGISPHSNKAQIAAHFYRRSFHFGDNFNSASLSELAVLILKKEVVVLPTDFVDGVIPTTPLEQAVKILRFVRKRDFNCGRTGFLLASLIENNLIKACAEDFHIAMPASVHEQAAYLYRSSLINSEDIKWSYGRLGRLVQNKIIEATVADFSHGRMPLSVPDQAAKLYKLGLSKNSLCMDSLQGMADLLADRLIKLNAGDFKLLGIKNKRQLSAEECAAKLYRKIIQQKTHPKSTSFSNFSSPFFESKYHLATVSLAKLILLKNITPTQDDYPFCNEVTQFQPKTQHILAMLKPIVSVVSMQAIVASLLREINHRMQPALLQPQNRGLPKRVPVRIIIPLQGNDRGEQMLRAQDQNIASSTAPASVLSPTITAPLSQRQVTTSIVSQNVAPVPASSSEIILDKKKRKAADTTYQGKIFDKKKKKNPEPDIDPDASLLLNLAKTR